MKEKEKRMKRGKYVRKVNKKKKSKLKIFLFIKKR